VRPINLLPPEVAEERTKRREDQQEINRTLEREVAALADAGALQAEFETKASLVRAALTDDVDWGKLLNDFSRLLPPRVWIESFSGTVATGAFPELVGEVSFNGVGFDFPDVSEWLRSLGSEAFSGITGPWVSTAVESTIGEEPVVNFSSTAALTTGAVTDRAEDLIPEVP
jgi:Tfp pilus assembly protein PilN